MRHETNWVAISDSTRAYVQSASGTMTHMEQAQHLGVTQDYVMRVRKAMGISSKRPLYTMAQREEVIACYEENGMRETQARFPSIRVRSIVETTAHAPRVQRWQDEDVLAVARMAGIVPRVTQIAMLNRRNADVHSLTRLWTRRLKSHSTAIHGIRTPYANFILRPGYPILETHSRPERVGRTCRHKLCLWVDAENWLQDGMPDFLIEGMRTMAAFQRWLFAPESPHDALRRITQKHSGV